MTTFRLLKPSRLAIEWEICKSWGAGNKEGERNNRFLLRFLICLLIGVCHMCECQCVPRVSVHVCHVCVNAGVCHMCMSAGVCHVCVSAHVCHAFVSAGVCECQCVPRVCVCCTKRAPSPLELGLQIASCLTWVMGCELESLQPWNDLFPYKVKHYKVQ